MSKLVKILNILVFNIVNSLSTLYINKKNRNFNFLNGWSSNLNQRPNEIKKKKKGKTYANPIHTHT